MRSNELHQHTTQYWANRKARKSINLLTLVTRANISSGLFNEIFVDFYIPYSTTKAQYTPVTGLLPHVADKDADLRDAGSDHASGPRDQSHVYRDVGHARIVA